MRINILFLLLALSGILPVKAQFNPEQAEKSLVKVMVTGGGTMGICSGFIWKKPEWIVTTLHSMKPGGIIAIEYPGMNLRDGKVIRVFESADLVLIETNIAAKPVTAPLVPLRSYAPGKPQFGEKIYAIGFNGGSLGNQTQQLEKGHANPETLWFLVREKDQASLKAIGFPSLEIPIYFLSGSLLPGFSGSPVYNSRNELIGIGDGGLERGQMNVSWCMPAGNLDLLENSATTTLPASLAKAELHYTAEVSIAVKSDDASVNYQAVSKQLEARYKFYTHGDFNFFQTKTRTLLEMTETAIDPENLYGFADEFNKQKIFFNYNSNYFDFDIYEDVNNGFVIALPVGTTLQYDEASRMFSAELSADDPNAAYFTLMYGMETHAGNPVAELISGFESVFGAQTQGLTRDPNYDKSFMLNDEWRADYFVLQGNAPYPLADGTGREVHPNIFVSLISNGQKSFYSLAICMVPTDRQDLATAFVNGVDCINHYDENLDGCEYFGWFFHVIAASQLTTISSLQ